MIKKKILTISVVFISVFILYLLIWGVNQILSVKKTQLLPPVSPPATLAVKVTTSLSLSPGKAIKYVGDIFETEVLVDSGLNTLSGVEFYLTFDPKKLKIEKVSSGRFFGTSPNILLNKTDQKTGKISFASGTFSPRKGVGTLAIVRFRVIKTTPENQPTIISFAEETKVADIAEKVSVLAKKEEAKYILLLKNE